MQKSLVVNKFEPLSDLLCPVKERLLGEGFLLGSAILPD